MARTRAEITSWERRWALPVAIATFLGIALMIVSGPLAGVSGDGDAEILHSVHDHSSSVVISGVVQGIAFLLLGVPLYYLFKVVQARSDRVRSQLVGLVIVAPLFLAISSGMSGAAQNEASDEYLNGEAKSTLTAREAHQKCVEERQEEGSKAFGEEFEPAQGETALAACETRKRADDEAENALGEASLAPAAAGLRLAGGLGFAVAIVYSCLWAMRTGVLSRFWAALGM